MWTKFPTIAQLATEHGSFLRNGGRGEGEKCLLCHHVEHPCFLQQTKNGSAESEEVGIAVPDACMSVTNTKTTEEGIRAVWSGSVLHVYLWDTKQIQSRPRSTTSS